MECVWLKQQSRSNYCTTVAVAVTGLDHSKLVAEWSSGEVAAATETLGRHYQPYADTIREKGVDGKALATLDALGVESRLHRRLLEQNLTVYCTKRSNATKSCWKNWRLRRSNKCENDADCSAFPPFVQFVRTYIEKVSVISSFCLKRIRDQKQDWTKTSYSTVLLGTAVRYHWAWLIRWVWSATEYRKRKHRLVPDHKSMPGSFPLQGNARLFANSRVQRQVVP